MPRGDAAALATAMAASRGDRPDVAAMRALAAQFTIEAAAPAWRRLLLAVAAQRGAGLRI